MHEAVTVGRRVQRLGGYYVVDEANHVQTICLSNILLCCNQS